MRRIVRVEVLGVGEEGEGGWLLDRRLTSLGFHVVVLGKEGYGSGMGGKSNCAGCGVWEVLGLFCAVMLGRNGSFEE
jgi:hypothetical protein